MEGVTVTYFTGSFGSLLFHKEKLLEDFQTYIAKSRYARYLDSEQRRETWDETVDRYFNYLQDRIPEGSYKTYFNNLRDDVKDMRVLPSMRALMSAGPALERDNTAAYNCSYLPIDHPRAVDEALNILMHGTGVGFSVERQYVSKLPEVPELSEVDTTIVVADSKEGWAKATRKLVGALFAGDIPRIDYSKIRPYGSRLVTFGGRASGPEPLKRLFDFLVASFKAAQGRKLSSVEWHEILCMVGDSVVSGGVRRSALISLSNLSDDRMRHAKSGKWWDTKPHLSLANNSVAYTERPEFDAFLREWQALYESRSGERGFFFRGAADKKVASIGRREAGHEWGTNPCSEIILRPYQFCNLSSVVVRPEDTLADLKLKVERATVLGTVQSTLTHFPYLRNIWKRNTEAERLLGVSLTGVMDHPVLSSVSDEARQWLREMRRAAVAMNAVWAEKLGIPVAAAITCVKPEGTVSQLTNTASGLHPRYAPYYIRRVQSDMSDPLSNFIIGQGVPTEIYRMQNNTYTHAFPMKSPEGARQRTEVGAIEQMEHWKMLQDEWCEHKPSITVYYKDSEFLALGQWVWDHFDEISGVAFLPYDGGTYEQAPYEEISKDKYEELLAQMPKIDWSKFTEKDDFTIASQTLACVGGSCDII